jgi:iron-sulfur cluster assembly protein
MLIVTPVATQEILAAAERSGARGMALRVAARRGADGRIEYGMGFDDQREDDRPARFDALTVLVGAPSHALLADTVLDFVEVDPGRFDFVFTVARAPNAADSGSTTSGVTHSGCGSGGCGSCPA